MSQRNRSIDVLASVGDGSVAKIGGIDALRQDGEHMQEIEVLRIVVESERGLHLSRANAEPVCEPVVGDGPVERRVPLSQMTQIAVVDLCADTESVGEL